MPSRSSLILLLFARDAAISSARVLGFLHISTPRIGEQDIASMHRWKTSTTTGTVKLFPVALTNACLLMHAASSGANPCKANRSTG